MNTGLPASLENLLNRLQQVSQENTLQLLDEAFHLASTMKPEDAAPLDSAVLGLLGDRRSGERLAEGVSLAGLESLAGRTLTRLAAAGGLLSLDLRRSAWGLLDILRRSDVRRRIVAAGATASWAGRILELVDASHFTFGELWAQRVAVYSGRVLFRLPGPSGPRTVTWHQAAGRVDQVARGLLALTGGDAAARVAILSENRLESALIDIACLSVGLVDVMIPATASDSEVAYMLAESRAGIVVASSREQLRKILKHRSTLPNLKRMIALDADAAIYDVLPFEHILKRAGEVPHEILSTRRDSIRIDDLATIMYTSGTTGQPKGICFSNRNMVFKRFARALAWPEIGEQDVFLAYLPLFHTFGRFMELQGTVFWGATYCFAPDPAINTLAQQMRELQPTMFISVPLKWLQLYDLVQQSVDVESAEEAAIRAAVRRTVGDRMRWGFTAAGYLDPHIIRFFQRYGVELISGFGMTEATGGITMTPPGCYRDESQGPALPGIEIALTEDSELVIRGPYVTIGYLGASGPESALDNDGWFHTGDLFVMDIDGYLSIIDRKKEIYKNVKGETVAPQKIENLFRDFESVGRIFVVGDNRPYNTALIFPNPEFVELNFSSLTPAELREHFRSLVITANSFLAPYERIVTFSIIDRDFEAGRDELTPKHTFRRKVIEKSFAGVIERMYRRTTLEVGGVSITFPNWLFQILGITAQDLSVEDSELFLASEGTSLMVRRTGEDEIQIGSAVYRSRESTINFGQLLSTPRLWLGNEELIDFAPLHPQLRYSRRLTPADLVWQKRVQAYSPTDADRETAVFLLRRKTLDLMDLHRAALLLGAADGEDALLGVRLLEMALRMEESPFVEAARRVLARAADADSATVVRRSFQVLATLEPVPRYSEALARFLNAAVRVLDDETITALVEQNLSSDRLEMFVAETEERCLCADVNSRNLDTANDLLTLLASYGIAHPTHYRALRAVLTRLALTAPLDRVRGMAKAARVRLREGFRNWLGAPSQIAVDPETGREYSWDDVVAFDDVVDDEARKRLIAAIKNTPLLAEAAFILSDKATVALADIPPGGVWIRRIGEDQAKSVYRVAVKTRMLEPIDVVINLNRRLSESQIEEEIDWMIICAEPRGSGPLVELFGGSWESHGLWTEEFIPGETIDHALNRLSRRQQDDERYRSIWPHAAWSGLARYVDFWNRTGRRLVIADPTPGKLIVPMHDYQTGARLVSITSRQPFVSIVSMLQSFREQFVERVEREHLRLEGLVDWNVILSSVLEVIGEQEGCALLRQIQTSRDDHLTEDLRIAAENYVDAVERLGFLPRRLFFAVQRFRRWLKINPNATLSAQAATLGELHETYGLQSLESMYPETRARFFRETVFRHAGQHLGDALVDIIQRLRRRQIQPSDLSAVVTDLRTQLNLTPEENYFLTRLSYPYLRPEDEAELVASAPGGASQSDMVVTMIDADGDAFQIRHALSPREIGRLHRMFLSAKLPLEFRPEHRFLIAVNDRGILTGGLFYELQPEARTAHMDKIVVAERYQRKGLATALLEELCRRLKTAGCRSLTTGFFRPQFFYRHGFVIEGGYAGLVRSLVDNEG
jgi:long-subunit acyl-CoA synthetase (AMP-forming)/GNAT superfamily N-acetyltransferase